MANILIVDDEKDIRELLADILEDEGHEAVAVGHAQGALDAVEASPPSLVILDIWLKESQMDGIDILKHIKTRHADIPVVIISGHGNVEIAVAAIRQGAFDFIEKPFNVDQLLVVVERALGVSALREENKRLSQNVTTAPEVIGSSLAFRHFQGALDKVARSQGRVMLQGEPGTGKEMAARYIHSHSARANAPFVTVVSAAIAPEDMERQLFGTEEGGKIYHGLFERANGGTLFFDEIADMPLETQGKILRVLTDQRFERGQTGQMIAVDCRVITSTKNDLKALIEEGKFREELYHRLNVVPIVVPTLAERREDIPALAEYFAKKVAATEKLAIRQFHAEAIEVLQAANWPGNIRELRNLVERLHILGEGKDVVEADEVVNNTSASGSTMSSEYLFQPLREARELFEQRYLMAQINRFAGNISRTAQFIGMERSALHRKMKSLGVATQGAGAVLVDEDETGH